MFDSKTTEALKKTMFCLASNKYERCQSVTDSVIREVNYPDGSFGNLYFYDVKTHFLLCFSI